MFQGLEVQGWKIAFRDGEPTVSLGSGTVKVGDEVVVSVTDFPASSGVSVGFEGTGRPRGAITTDSQGAGSVTLRIAGLAPGTYRLIATGPEGTRAAVTIVVEAGRSAAHRQDGGIEIAPA